MGTHYYVEYDRRKAQFHYDKVENIIQDNINAIQDEWAARKEEQLRRQETKSGGDWQEEEEKMANDVKSKLHSLDRDMTDLNAHRNRLAVATCDWENYDENLYVLVEQIKRHY